MVTDIVNGVAVLFVGTNNGQIKKVRNMWNIILFCSCIYLFSLIIYYFIYNLFTRPCQFIPLDNTYFWQQLFYNISLFGLQIILEPNDIEPSNVKQYAELTIEPGAVMNSNLLIDPLGKYLYAATTNKVFAMYSISCIAVKCI